MVDVVIPGRLAESGPLPAICMVHGRPATKWRRRRFSQKTPTWAWPLAVIAMLPTMIVLAVVLKKVTGPVPECDDCRARQRRVKSVCWLVGLGSLLLFVAAAATTNEALMTTWLLSLLPALVLPFVLPDRARVRGHVDAANNVVAQVHPAFAHELGAWYAAWSRQAAGQQTL